MTSLSLSTPSTTTRFIAATLAVTISSTSTTAGKCNNNNNNVSVTNTPVIRLWRDLVLPDPSRIRFIPNTAHSAMGISLSADRMTASWQENNAAFIRSLVAHSGDSDSDRLGVDELDSWAVVGFAPLHCPPDACIRLEEFPHFSFKGYFGGASAHLSVRGARVGHPIRRGSIIRATYNRRGARNLVFH